MNLLKHHSEKLLAALVAAACIALVLCTRDSAEPPWQAELAGYQQIVSRALAKPASPNYQYSARAAEQIKSFTMRPGRSGQPAEALPDIPQFVAYSQPARPWVTPKPPPVEVREVFASLGTVTNIKARVEPSGITLDFSPPRNPKYMEVVRVEIFRSDTADTLEGSPYSVVQITTENSMETAAPAAPAPEPSSERTRRRNAEKPAAKPPVAAPSTSRFVDTHVEPCKAYHYQFRAIGRMTASPGVVISNGNPLAGTVPAVLRAPGDAQPLAASQPGASLPLFATPLSAPLTVTAVSNCEIRLAGVAGNFAAPDAPPHRVTTDYKANFAVRVWLSEPQLWRETTIQVGLGERVRGKVLYPDATTKRLAAYEFDTGYELAELKWGEITTGGHAKVPLTNPDGTPVVNEVGRLVSADVVVPGDSIPNEVAMLKNTRTGAMEEFPKRSAALVRKD